MIEIPLTQGYVALIDDQDFDLVSKYKWYADIRKQGRIVYARSTISSGKKKPLTTILMHRLVKGYKSRSPRIDHWDGNGCNNQKYNLRPCNQTQNLGNQRKRAGTTSKYKGVYWDKKWRKWVARIKIGRTTKYLGSFDDEDAAALSYNEAAKIEFGEFARLNIVEVQSESG